MNKIGKAMLCTVLTGAMAVGAAGAADLGSLSPQGAKAYLRIRSPPCRISMARLPPARTMASRDC